MNSISLERVIISLLLLFIVAQPLYSYSVRIGGVGLSFDRLILLAAFLLFIVACLNARKVSFPLLFIYILFLLVFTGANAAFSTGENNVMLPAIYSILVFLLFSEIRYRSNGFHIATNIGFCIYLLFTGYALIYFIQTGLNLVYKPLYQFMPFLDSALMSKAEEMSKGFSFLPRFQFPFATPPHLAVVNAVFALYYYYYFNKCKNGKTKILYLLAFLLAIASILLTQSRSGAFTLVIALVVFSILQNNLIKHSIKIVFFSVILFMPIVYIVGLDNLLLFTRRLTDLSSINVNSGHYIARVDGVNYFKSMLFYENIFGSGIGSYPFLHTHMSYLTILIERGVIGLILFIVPLGIVLFKVINVLMSAKKLGNERLDYSYHLAGVILIYIAHFTYEFTYVMPLYVFLGYHLKHLLADKPKPGRMGSVN
jgi:hypothetical protein